MTMREFSYLGVGADLGNTSRQAMRGEAQIYLGDPTKGIDPLFTMGLFSLGRPKNMPDFKKVVNLEKIQAGYPKNHLYSIPVSEEMELSFVIDHPKALAFQLQRGDVAMEYNYASTGQTTIASASTKTSATLTAGTGISVGDACLVATEHLTYGGFKEIAYIKSISGAAVTFEGLTQAAPVGATFKKIIGKTTGTSKADTGIRLHSSLTTKLEVFHAVFVVPLVGSKGEIVVSVPELEIKPESIIPNFSGTLAEMSFTGMPRTQAEKSFTLTDGTTEARPWCMEAWWIPYEAA